MNEKNLIPTLQTISGLGNHQVEVFGKTTLTMNIHGIDRTIEAIVVNDNEIPITNSIILGIDFLESNKAIINFGARSLTFEKFPPCESLR